MDRLKRIEEYLTLADDARARAATCREELKASYLQIAKDYEALAETVSLIAESHRVLDETRPKAKSKPSNSN